MATQGHIPISSNFDRRSPIPVDPSLYRDDIADRDAIPVWQRYPNMQIDILGSNVSYKLILGTVDMDLANNANWVEIFNTLDPSDYYTKINLQTSGESEVHWDNITNAPSTFVATWGTIIGTLADQTDLNNALGNKEDVFAKNTGFNLPLGVIANTVAEGDHKHSQLYQPDGTNPFVYTDNAGNLFVDGDIIQSGVGYETHVEQVWSALDLIITRDGAVAGLGAGEYTGIQATLYDGVNDGQLVFDNGGVARVGDIGSLQPIATREETPTNGYYAQWSTANQRFETVAISANRIENTATTSYVEYGNSGTDTFLTSVSTSSGGAGDLFRMYNGLSGLLFSINDEGAVLFKHSLNSNDTTIDGNNITLRGIAAVGNYIYGDGGAYFRLPVGNGRAYHQVYPKTSTEEILRFSSSTGVNYQGSSVHHNKYTMYGATIPMLRWRHPLDNSHSDFVDGLHIGSDYHHNSFPMGATYIYSADSREAAAAYDAQSIHLIPGKILGLSTGVDGAVVIGASDRATPIYFIDNTTIIGKDGSNNLFFTDAVTGTKTLAELAAGSIGRRIENTATTSYLEYSDSGGDAFLTAVTTLTGDDEVFGITNGSADKIFKMNAQGSFFNDGFRAFAYHPVQHSIYIGDRKLTDPLLTGASRNIGIGEGTFTDLSTGDDNILIGYYAGTNMSTSTHNVAIGSYAMTSMVASSDNNVAIGYRAGYSAIGDGIISIGAFAERGGNSTISIGYYAGYGSTGANNIHIGANTGAVSGYTGTRNIFIGTYSGGAMGSGFDNVFIGSYSGKYETGSNTFMVSGLSAAEQVDEATARTKALIYGIFDPTTTSQTIRFNANVGIGVAPGGAPLTLKAQAEDETVFRINEVNSNARAFEIGFSGTNSPFIHFKRRYSDIAYDVMTFDRTNGYVGIGTTSPDYPLHVLRAGGSGTAAFMSGSGYNVDTYYGHGTTYQWRLGTSSVADFRLRDEVAGATRLLIVQATAKTHMIGVYNNSVANAANVYVASDGALLRSTSSIKIKKQIKDYIDPNFALQFIPVSFTSKQDNTKHIGFIAEWMDKVDPRFATNQEEEGLMGLDMNAIVSALTATVQEQQREIEQLKSDIKAIKQYLNL